MSAHAKAQSMLLFPSPTPGIGIAPELHSTIFRDFVQIDSPLQKKWHGTGLGLTLSKQMAENSWRQREHDQPAWRRFDVRRDDPLPA